LRCVGATPYIHLLARVVAVDEGILKVIRKRERKKQISSKREARAGVGNDMEGQPGLATHIQHRSPSNPD
jgi:hypothetical protein